MKMSSLVRLATVLGIGAVTPVVALAPRPRGGDLTVDDLVRQVSASSLQGWHLVDHATAVVHASFDHYSAWHLWETPAQALAGGRGSSVQVNQVLAEVLDGLGFDVELVHAARVRFGGNPWWHAGHLWARVRIGDDLRDVCAVDGRNRAGHVVFTPLTEVREVHPWTVPAGMLGLAPFVVVQVWRQLLLGDEVPSWMYRPFDQRA